MRRFAAFVTILLLMGVSAWQCSDSPTDSETGRLVVRLTDAAADFDEVNITFSEISAHIDSSWITVQGEAQTVNLLEWNNGNSIIIGTAEVPAGQYTQIRLKIVSAEVVIEGQTFPMMVPSGAQTGLKLISNFTVPGGSTFELMIDFDANRSVVTTGPPNNPTGYKLKPTIRVTPIAITGSISGTVTNPVNAPTAFAIAAGDTVTSSAVDAGTGNFMLAFLPEGSYTVSITDGTESFEQSGVSVTPGSDNNIGTVTLGSSPGQTQTGTLRVSITDATGDFDEVNITFSEVSAHIDSEWVTVSIEPQTVNLLDFTNGETFELGSNEVPAGHYTQVRLKIDEAEVVTDGETHPVTIPSNAQTGLKLVLNFTILEGETVELILDFDAHRSIITTGPPNSPRNYMMKPTIRVITMSNTGSISGMVTNPTNAPVAFAIANTDTITSTPVNVSSGHFKLAFLPAGIYTVAIEDTAGARFQQDGIEVFVNMDTDLGAITLE